MPMREHFEHLSLELARAVPSGVAVDVDVLEQDEVRGAAPAELPVGAAVCRVGRRFPTIAPKIAKLLTSSVSERELTDRSDRVFASPRRVR